MGRRGRFGSMYDTGCMSDGRQVQDQIRRASEGGMQHTIALRSVPGVRI
jgi:hypothetical protein